MARNARGLGWNSDLAHGAVEELGGSYAVEQIRYRARIIAEVHALNEADREDLEAELTARVWRMLPKHSPEKASLRTFASLVIANGISAFIRRRKAECRDPRREEFDLHETVPGSENESCRANDDPACESKQIDIDLMIDVQQVISELPPHLRNLCEWMKKKSLREISRATNISRHTLHDWVAEIREIFKSKALDAYLPVRRSESLQ